MLQKTQKFMKEHQMGEPKEKLVIGLSGGMDSVCLFHILKDLGFSLEAVHVHHGIRGEEADRDEAFARALCERYNIPFHGYRFDVPKISRESHLSEEEAGRMVRKQAFFEVQKACGAKYIALAHHANDRAETFLFHLSRGTGVKGLGAMKPVQGEIIRPLLWAKREEIEKYVNANAYDFVEDGTNKLNQYTRNRIRHQVLPILEEVNSRSVEHICNAAEKLSAVGAYIDREAEKLCRLSAVMYEKEVQIFKFAFCQGDAVLRIPVLQKCVEYLCGSLANITEEHLQAILALFEMQTGKEIHLPYGLVAVRTYEGIRMFFREEIRRTEPVEITGEGSYEFGGLAFLVSVEPWDERKIFPIKNYTKCFDYDKITENVFLRTRESGDYLEINKDHGRKSLQDYLVNEKVPKEERDRVMLLCDGSHVLWVVGKRISEYYKVTKDTKKVLKVQVCGGNVHEEIYG
ncbi:MAG: tRNA lysidine(34) synthetase TilS [Lachnospiraceae bacterium]|nr:tRNA lysidine(34) synthetase TilS [Lachnospiraceae bacterium]